MLALLGPLLVLSDTYRMRASVEEILAVIDAQRAA